MRLVEIQERQEWNDLLLRLPRPHILQTWEWGEFKHAYGWQPRRLAFLQGDTPVAAISLLRRRTGPLSVLYVPKGPILDTDNPGLAREVLGQLEDIARSTRAIFVKIDPDVIISRTSAEQSLPSGAEPLPPFVDALMARGWHTSREQIQFRNTVTLDLNGSEDDWLARMKSKTRYNIRLAERKGVTVRQAGADELELLYRMYAETAARDDFIIRPLDYYRKAWASFLEAGLAAALVAEFQGEPLAAILLFAFGRRAWYFYGMSRDLHRNLMPAYLLQWEAMRWARHHGCDEYDLWGAPEVFDERDPMWGVFRFKQGLGGCIVRHIGAYDYPTNPAFYWAYTVAMPQYLEMLRRLYRYSHGAPRAAPANDS